AIEVIVSTDLTPAWSGGDHFVGFRSSSTPRDMPRFFDYLTLAAVTVLFWSSVSQQRNLRNIPSTNQMECQVPGERTLYIPINRNYCIYGIGFTSEKYEEEVFYNDNASPYSDQLETAATPACNSNPLTESEYSGGWIQTSNRTLNIFFVCCKNCDELNTSKEGIRLRLKNVFTAYSYMNIKKVYEVFETKDEMKELLYAERYLLLIDDEEASSRVIDLPICLSEGFRLSVSLVYTPICWVKTSWRRQCEICGDPPGKEFLNIRLDKDLRLQRTLGPYDAFSSRMVEELRCNNSDHVNRCHYWDNHTTYNVECCCYGSDTERIACQSHLMRAGRAVDGDQPNCAVRTMLTTEGVKAFESVVNDLMHNNDSSSASEVLTDTLAGMLQDLEATNHCVTYLCHVPWANRPYIYVHEQRQLRLSQVNASLVAEESPKCEDLAVDDYRLRDIYIRQCYPANPLRRMCPFHYFDYDRTLEASSILCCCNDESFCNHEVGRSVLYCCETNRTICDPCWRLGNTGLWSLFLYERDHADTPYWPRKVLLTETNAHKIVRRGYAARMSTNYHFACY
ncbi:hypothetical protein Tcan_03724, partial [Toxocara canis]